MKRLLLLSISVMLFAGSLLAQTECPIDTIWNVPLPKFPTVRSTHVSADQQMVAVNADDSILVFDTNNGDLLKIYDTDLLLNSAWNFEISADFSIALAFIHNEIKTINVFDSALIHRYSPLPNRLTDLELTSDGSTAYMAVKTGTDINYIYKFDVPSRSVVDTLFLEEIYGSQKIHLTQTEDYLLVDHYITNDSINHYHFFAIDTRDFKSFKVLQEYYGSFIVNVPQFTASMNDTNIVAYKSAKDLVINDLDADTEQIVLKDIGPSGQLIPQYFTNDNRYLILFDMWWYQTEFLNMEDYEIKCKKEFWSGFGDLDTNNNSYGRLMGSRFCKVRLGLPTSVREEPHSVESLSAIYSSGYLNVEYDLTEPGEISIVVYDIEGRPLTAPKTSYKTIGHHQLQIPLDLASGSYLVVIESDSGIQTVKFTVIL
jgi:hypothetical protein